MPVLDRRSLPQHGLEVTMSDFVKNGEARAWWDA